jgi:hypothetical protein
MGVSLLLPALTSATEERGSDVISVLSYNVHGLFPLAAGSEPGDSSATIGWLANKYDVVLFQEDFEYHADLAAQMLGKTGIRGNGVGTDPRRLIPKILLAPFALFIPHFWPPYGSGLSVFTRTDLAIVDDVDRIPYGVCSAWFSGTADCWSAKGFVRIGIRLGNGAEVDVYDTHLQAGPEKKAVNARRQQLLLMAELIEARGATRGVIVGGDLNLGCNRPGDLDVLMDFRERLQLRDSGAGPQVEFWRERDHLLYRDGATARVSVEEAGEAQEFVNEGRALSDHPALYARFRIDRPATQEKEVQ